MEDAPYICTRCKQNVKYPDLHKNREHPGLTDYSFIMTREQYEQRTLLDEKGQPIQKGKYLWFYGDDPARDRDYQAIIIQGLPARKTEKWLPMIRDLYRFQHRNYLDTLEFLAKELFVKMPPTLYTVDASNNPAYAELLIKKLGTNRVMPLKFGNAGNTNTKYDLKVITKQYFKLGYEFPDPDLLLRQKRITAEKAGLLRILKEEALREMAILTETERISFQHPPGKNNDMIHGFEMSNKGVWEFQKNHSFGTPFAATAPMRGASRQTAISETPLEVANSGILARMQSLGLNIKDYKIEMPDNSKI